MILIVDIDFFRVSNNGVSQQYNGAFIGFQQGLFNIVHAFRKLLLGYASSEEQLLSIEHVASNIDESNSSGKIPVV